MFTNQNGCTVWEKTEKNRAPTYVRHETGAVYWEDNSSQNSGKDRSPANQVFISIPAKSLDGYLPKSDDRIMCGIIPDTQPPPTALTVITAKNRLYGSPRVQHMEVYAK